MPPKKYLTRQTSEGEDSDESTATITAAGATRPAPASMITMTEEQLSSIFANIARTQAEANRILIENMISTRMYGGPTPEHDASSPGASGAGITAAAASPAYYAQTAGSFAKCTARFSGEENSPEVLGAFLDAVETYKECTSVSDHHALKGLPMLLTGNAALWWQGIKSMTTTWAEAVVALRGMYGTPRPAYKLFREIFSTEQSSERAEVFITRVRCLISKLPYGLSECIILDIIYGLLHRRIRKRLPRDSITSVENLIHRARSVEEAIVEVEVSPVHNNSIPRYFDEHSAIVNVTSNNPTIRSNSNVTSPTTSITHVNKHVTPDIDSKSKRNRQRCSFCRIYGHNIEECRNLESKRNNEVTSNEKGERGKSHPDRFFSQFKGETNSDTSTLRCYGCGQPGVIRSRCSNCKGAVQSPKKVDFSTLYSVANVNPRPIIDITILGRDGVATVDTGASHCVASTSLHKILSARGTKFMHERRLLGLADGSQRVREVLTARVDVVIKGRTIPTDFLILPESDPKTLLGRDFIANSQIVLDISNGSWYFSDSVEETFPFIEKYDLRDSETQLMHADTELFSLRTDEGQNLTIDQRARLNDFILQNAERFATEGPPTDFAVHRIKVNDNQEPIACQPYRLSHAKKEALKIEIDKLLDADIIEECESPWAANTVLVPKKDGGTRLCIDYRKLNAVTEPDRYPLPRMEDILHAAKRTGFMTTLDLRSGYFHVSVHPDDRDKTAFVSPIGTFRFKRMPMGLRNSGATFQRLIDRFKSNLKNVTLWGYLDDMILVSETFEQHLQDLKAVFDRLAMFGLRVNREKSFFAKDSVKFLGHVIIPGGIHMDPGKTAAILAMQPPQNLKHLKCFLQTASWFRRFIPEYAEVARPLTNLLKKVSKWHWGTDQQAAFERLKELLSSAPVLRQADETKPFTLRTDSSGYALGAALLQGEGTDERPIEYASRLLTAAEKNYNTTEREALAVVWAVLKFRGYIDGAEVIVKSDHQPLRWLMSMRSPSGRLARWALSLQEYNLKIEYTPGKANVLADTLSRPTCEDDNTCDLCLTTVDMPSRDPNDVRENQLKDADVRKVIEAMESDDLFRGRTWADKGYVMTDGVLYRYCPENEDGDDASLVVPEHERKDILAEYHDAPTAGHFGVERTLSRIAGKYYWPNMRAFVADHIKTCVPCQRYKVDTRKPAGLLQTPAANRRFEVLAVDLFGPLPETADGNKWILILEDTCTKWVELFALPNATSEECARTLITEVFLRYGVPRRVISDNGVQFISGVMQQVCHFFGISQSLTPVYHPEANPVERKNRDLKPQLAILVGQDHTTWDTHLAAIRFAMNSAVTGSTGYSPAFLMYGRELRAPGDVLTDMRTIVDCDSVATTLTPYLKRLTTALLDSRDRHEKAQARRNKYENEHRRPAPDYTVGDLVLLKTQGANDACRGQTPKLIPRRDGPYRIHDIVSPTTYILERIRDKSILGKYHASVLTPFVGHILEPLQEKRKRGRPRRANPRSGATHSG